MKYIDILRKFDTACVNESKRLYNIYESVCNDKQVCEDGDVEVDKNEKEIKDNLKTPQEVTGQSTEDNTSEESTTEEPTTSESDDDKQMCAYEAQNNNQKLMSPEEFFKDDDTEPKRSEIEVEVDPSNKQDNDNEDDFKITSNNNDADQTNENENENLEKMASINASSLFEDEKTNDKCDPSACDTQEAAADTTNSSDTTASQSDNTTEQDVEKESIESREKTLKDWLGERETECGAAKPQSNDCDSEEQSQQKSLQESIRNISAFVKANKKLFVG